MSREAPVRFREGLGVKFPRATRLLITGTSKELLRDQVQPLVAHFLKERGLELSHEKTRITHIEEGFDFLGQNVRRYRNGKVLTKPSASSVKTFLSKIQETIDDSGGLTAGELIRRLNQQIKGWTMYHRYAASKSTFGAWITGSSRWCGGGVGDDIRRRAGSGSGGDTSRATNIATGSSPGCCVTRKAGTGRSS